MARPRLTEAARVSIALKVSQVDAAQIDEVLTRPEFAGWTRAEWCREIIRTALRYYVGDASAPDPGQAPAPDPGQGRVPARPAAAEPVTPEPVTPEPEPPESVPSESVPSEPAAASAMGPAVPPRSQAGEPGAGGSATAAPMPPAAAAPMPPATGEPRPGSREASEPPAEPACPHPAEARDWQTGTCAACGAILWD